MVPKPTIHSNEEQQIFHSKRGKNPVIMFWFFSLLCSNEALAATC